MIEMFYSLNLFLERKELIEGSLTAKGGGVTVFRGEYGLTINGTTETVAAHRLHSFYYGFGTGAAFYPFKHIGVFSEFTYEAYFNTKAWFLKYGLSVKF